MSPELNSSYCQNLSHTVRKEALYLQAFLLILRCNLDSHGMPVVRMAVMTQPQISIHPTSLTLRFETAFALTEYLTEISHTDINMIN